MVGFYMEDVNSFNFPFELERSVFLFGIYVCLWLYDCIGIWTLTFRNFTSLHCQWCKLLDQSWLINTVKAILVPDTMEAMSMCFWNIWLLSLGNSWIGMMTVDTYIQVHWHGWKIVSEACIRGFWAGSCKMGRYVYPCILIVSSFFMLSWRSYVLH